MIRLIKRYESRKLYDTEESRYVSLEEISQWIRDGQEVQVVDNASGADVTSQTLTQIILDEGRRVQHGVDRLVQASVDRLAPVRRAREEMSRLRSQLERLEGSLSRLESEREGAEEAAVGAGRKK
jgi:polyhydroxyalkanoate synthesis repressor PhaR